MVLGQRFVRKEVAAIYGCVFLAIGTWGAAAVAANGSVFSLLAAHIDAAEVAVEVAVAEVGEGGRRMWRGLGS